MVIAVLIAIIFILIAYFAYKKFALNQGRKGHKKRMLEFHTAWDENLSNRFAPYKMLDSSSKKRLLDLISIFISEKEWAQDIIEERKLSIATQACYPVLNRTTNLYPSVKLVTTAMDQDYWYNLNSAQFEFELGKMASFKTKSRFNQLSHQYFYENESLKESEPEIYSWLDIYYNNKK